MPLSWDEIRRAQPRYVMVSDFGRFRLHDLDNNEQHDFVLADLYDPLTKSPELVKAHPSARSYRGCRLRQNRLQN